MAGLKITGFGRFVIFLLIVAPIAYFGMQYLEKNGTLDDLRDKVDNKEVESIPEASDESASDILKDIETESVADREEESLIEKQRREIEELKRQNEALQRQRESSSSTVTIPPATQTPPPPPSTSSRTTDNAPSLDDLIRQAENKTGRPTSSPEPSQPTNKESLATWAFSFQNVSGEIEFYQENGRLMSRTVYRGANRVDVQELVQRDDRYYVRNSPTKEYYVVRSDGNLDAYDEDGFQTTCRRSR